MTATLPDAPFVVDPVPPPRFSMSFIRAAGACLRRAHFERIDDSTGDPAVIGRIFHEIAAKVGEQVTFFERTRPLPGEVERIARYVMANPGEHDPMPRRVWAEVLELCAKWEKTCEFTLGEEFERDARHPIGPTGRIVSARIDRRLIVGMIAYVKDYKSGWADPPSAPAPSPQGDVYAWETVQEFPWVTEVHFQADHIRFGTGAPYVYTREEIDNEIEPWLLDEVSRLEAAYAAGGELPTNPGDACDLYDGCPVARDCPAKAWTRPSTLIETEAEAIAEANAASAERASASTRDEAVKGYLTRTGQRALLLGESEIGFGIEGGTKTDWKGLALAKGTEADVAAFTVNKKSAFGRRKVAS